MENRNYTNKIITKVEKEDTIITDQNDILREVKTFYEKLYSENQDLDDVDLNNVINSTHINKLNEEESNNLGGRITSREALMCLKKMKNDKSPGYDGFPVEFFKFF